MKNDMRGWLNCVLRNHSPFFFFKSTNFYLRDFACHSFTAYWDHLAPSKLNSTFQDSPFLKELMLNQGMQSAHTSLIWASFISTGAKNIFMTSKISIWDITCIRRTPMTVWRCKGMTELITRLPLWTPGVEDTRVTRNEWCLSVLF